ncbi:hypothetical protein ABCR94_33155 [Streptomyces sp. 21So2-11]
MSSVWLVRSVASRLDAGNMHELSMRGAVRAGPHRRPRPRVD